MLKQMKTQMKASYELGMDLGTEAGPKFMKAYRVMMFWVLAGLAGVFAYYHLWVLCFIAIASWHSQFLFNELYWKLATMIHYLKEKGEKEGAPEN